MAQIILENSALGQMCWQKELADSFTDPEALLNYLNLPLDNYSEDIKARKLFPMRVPKPYAARIEKSDAADPLLLQVLPVRQEFDEVAGYVADPLEEHDTVLPGLLHKYKSRVLLMVRGGCAVNCRYCFRRHFPYADNNLNKQQWIAIEDYLHQHPEINEVIFSGGDPLMANDQQLEWILKAIENIPHIKRVRFHTRLPVVIPTRITEQFVNLMSSSRLAMIMVVHINHANEIDEELTAAMADLKSVGVTLLNQSVLLKGVNDSPAALIKLSEALFAAGIMPYYLHVLDKVSGAAHFDLTDAIAKQLIKQINAELPGFLVPKLVREEANQANKTPLNLD